jgi:hypothetical protein
LVNPKDAYDDDEDAVTRVENELSRSSRGAVAASAPAPSSRAVSTEPEAPPSTVDAEAAPDTTRTFEGSLGPLPPGERALAAGAETADDDTSTNPARTLASRLESFGLARPLGRVDPEERTSVHTDLDVAVFEKRVDTLGEPLVVAAVAAEGPALPSTERAVREPSGPASTVPLAPPLNASASLPAPVPVGLPPVAPSWPPSAGLSLGAAPVDVAPLHHLVPYPAPMPPLASPPPFAPPALAPPPAARPRRRGSGGALALLSVVVVAASAGAVLRSGFRPAWLGRFAPAAASTPAPPSASTSGGVDAGAAAAVDAGAAPLPSAGLDAGVSLPLIADAGPKTPPSPSSSASGRGRGRRPKPR